MRQQELQIQAPGHSKPSQTTPEQVPGVLGDAPLPNSPQLVHPRAVYKKGALDSDTVKGAVRLPGNLGLPGSWMLPEDGHTLFSSADPMENPPESLVTSGKNTWRGFRQRFKGMEGAGNGRSPILSARPDIPSPQLLPALPDLSSPCGLSLAGQGTKARAGMV